MSKFIGILSSSVVGAGLLAGLAQAEEINIATVNNGDMIIMQKLSSAWEKETGNKINWIVLEENVLRERVTSKGGTTHAALASMDASGIKAAIVLALKAAAARGKALGEEFGSDDTAC